ncbi:MAG: CvpA family protein [Bacilli bacterium]|jgi:uncharacterized membrane protein required for colicin V production|nr:CvpA family protein [Bacilli bacterium]
MGLELKVLADLSNYKFDWISLVYLAIILIWMILGIKKGLLWTILSLFGVALAVAGAYFLCKPTGNFIKGLNGWGDSSQQSIYDFLVSKNSDVSMSIPKSYLEDSDNMASLLNSLGIPSVFHGYVGKFVLAAIPDSGSEAVGIYIAQAVNTFFYTSIAFLILFILFLIVVGILKLLTKKLIQNKVFGPIDRLFGGILGLAIGAVFVLGISFGLAFIATSNSAIYTWLDGIIYLSDDSVFTITKYLYTENFLVKLLGFAGVSLT